MKKNILIFSSVIITLIIITSILPNNDSNNTLESTNIAIKTSEEKKIKQTVFNDFIYDVGTRFSPIKKSNINKARTINDFIKEEITDEIINIKSVSVVIIERDKETNVIEIGNTKALTKAQLKLLKSSNHNTNISVRVDFMQVNKTTGMIEANYNSPYLTIVPEIEAEYINGKESLLNYLRANGKKVVSDANVIAKKLKPAKLYFTVTKTGTIKNVNLDRSSNYPIVDKKMMELIKSTEHKWKPAINNKGERVDQELVVSFGLMGC